MLMVMRDTLLGLLLLCGVAACTWSGLQAGNSSARRIYVAGELEHTDADRIAEVAAPYVQASFFDMDIHHMAQDLETLPWLADIRIQRHWPDGVVIHVTEHKPIARWGHDGVLTDDFTVIEPQRTASLAGLPQLSGPADAGNRVYNRFRDMNQRLAASSRLRIARLELDARGAWRATLNNGLALRFGRDHLDERLQRFIDYALAQARSALAGAGYVDLRYSDGFAIGGERPGIDQEEMNEQKA